MRASLVTMVSALWFSMPLYAADMVVVKWDRGGDHQSVAAFDLTKREMVWESTSCRVPNFAEKTSSGVLVGCDDSTVMLLEVESGRILWRRDLAMRETDELRAERRPFREIKINRFQSERAEGFFLSESDEIYVLMGKKGEYLMRCDKLGCTASPKADREGPKK